MNCVFSELSLSLFDDIHLSISEMQTVTLEIIESAFPNLSKSYTAGHRQRNSVFQGLLIRWLSLGYRRSYNRNKRGPSTLPCGTPDDRRRRRWLSHAVEDDLLSSTSQERCQPRKSAMKRKSERCQPRCQTTKVHPNKISRR